MTVEVCNAQPAIEDDDEDDYEAPPNGGLPLYAAPGAPEPDQGLEDA